MWLLDNNVPRQIIPVLQSFSVSFDTAKQRKWGELRNGELLAAASASGFTAILTRDILFREEATKAFKNHPHMAIVLLVIPQMLGKQYAEVFAQAWAKKAIIPVPGQLLIWPE